MLISDPEFPQKYIGDGAPLIPDILMMIPSSVIIIHQIKSFRPEKGIRQQM
jgi:ATP-dependent 26S proteasome regulatory subunit